MPNYGKYYIGIRLLLLKEYLQANAGKDRIVKRRELEEYLMEQGYPVEKKTLYADFAVLDCQLVDEILDNPNDAASNCFLTPFVTVAARMGHSQTSKTLDTYAHALQRTNKSTAIALENLLGK